MGGRSQTTATFRARVLVRVCSLTPYGPLFAASASDFESARACNFSRRIAPDRQLTINVLAEDSASPLDSNAAAFINVHTRGLNAHAPGLYNMGEVAGIDFDVQAVLVSQTINAEVLCDACRSIELQELETFAFVCSHATHRSCGCAVLLAILVYQHAHIVFSTNRTRRAAQQRGMISLNLSHLTLISSNFVFFIPSFLFLFFAETMWTLCIISSQLRIFNQV